jgi:hypothetical protein
VRKLTRGDTIARPNGPPKIATAGLHYQRAVGYGYNAVKVMQNNGEPVYAEYVEHVPPDPGAAKLSLTNRRAEEWRDKSTTELTGKDGAPLVPVLNVTISRTELVLHQSF